MDPAVLTVYKSPYDKVRLGKDNDGGYIIAQIPDVSYDLFLSGGIETDISFEEDFIEMYDPLTYSFDGTINCLPKENNKINFIKKNIGNENTENITNLHNEINLAKNIFIKMDIEGGEIPWILSLSNEHMNKFAQIVMEFHFPFLEVEKEVFNKLNTNHYLIHFHGNNYESTQIHKDVIIPNVFECTYLHKKYFNSIPKLNSDLIPGLLDMSNNKFNQDICINYSPFVNL